MKNKKWFIILLTVIVVAIIVAVIWYTSSTRWTRDFDIRYVDHISEWETGNHSGKSYDLYEITNTTEHTLKDVYVVISVDAFHDSFKYEDYVAHSIRPGETVEYRLYSGDYEEAAEEQGKRPIVIHSIDVVKIKYSR